jgi:hypothetical protein
MAEHRSLFERALLGEISPLEIIELVRTLYSDKFIVCKSAVKSAAALSNIPASECTDLLQCFMKLSTQAYDLIRRGTPFTDACQQLFGEHVFGDTDLIQAKHGPRTNENPIFEAPNGRNYRMSTYLRVAFRDNRLRTVRIHLVWDAEQNKFIIGSCGEHIETG